MFRDMRRKRQLMPQEACIEVLKSGSHGVLAVSGDDGYPYTVPLSYVYHNGCIYFHGAKSGHKIDAIARNNKVSFCVVSRDQNVPAEFTTYFESVVVFGRASLVTDDREKLDAIHAICARYSPDETEQSRDAAIAREWSPLAIIRVDIEHMTGKQAIELVKKKTTD